LWKEGLCTTCFADDVNKEMRKTFDKPVAPFPAARAFCLKTMLDQHSLSTNASRIVHRHELGRRDDVQEEFQPALN
jgi:hypothetical protein